jgi:hypothetical protein
MFSVWWMGSSTGRHLAMLDLEIAIDNKIQFFEK